MLLRTSSTPVLGSMLSSFYDSPNNSYHNQGLEKSPLHHHQLRSVSLTRVGSYTSSLISPYIGARKSLRPAQSEGNLAELAFASCNTNGNEDCQVKSQPKRVSGRQKRLMLETIPSFSLRKLTSRFEEEYDDYQNEFAEEEQRMKVEDEGDLSTKTKNRVSGERAEVTGRSWNVGFEEKRRVLISEDMYLVGGLGIDGGNKDGNGGGGGGGGDFNWAGGDGRDIQGTEEYYKKRVQENPANALFLRNYAQFLHQKKRDLKGAEEYYSRAIIADPKDGEILSKYAKLVWKLHCDVDKASSYFEMAIQASPEDSHVRAAYASFLWETEEDENECVVPGGLHTLPSHFHEGVMTSRND